MTSLSPARADAFELLRSDLYEHLDEAEFLAMKFAAWRVDDIDAARRLIPDLVTVIRGVLLMHGTTDDGSCSHCGMSWPCADVETIHRLVKDPDATFCALLHRP